MAGRDGAHLPDIEDGAGCVEIWERLEADRNAHQDCEGCGDWRGEPVDRDGTDAEWLCRDCQLLLVNDGGKK